MEIKSAEQYVLRDLENLQKELDLQRKVNEELTLQLQRFVKKAPITNEEDASLGSLILSPMSLDIVRVEVASGYSIRNAISKDKIDGKLVLLALTDDDALDKFAKMEWRGEYSYSGMDSAIQVSSYTSSYTFEYRGFPMFLSGNGVPDVRAFNVHLVNQAMLSEYDRVKSDFVTRDELDEMLPSYKLGLRSNIKQYAKEIEAIVNPVVEETLAEEELAKED